jgi:organic radical activating enzyme
MSKIKIAELFYSIQGEGRYMGVPSVFLRTFGCNFKCAGFGMPKGESSSEVEAIAERIAEFKSYDELPLVSTGCDSYASWDPRFKDLSPMLTSDAIAERIMEIIPFNEWRDEHLVITGGEPLLGWQRAYPDLLNHPKMAGLKEITFETNGTQALTKDFSAYLHQWKSHHNQDFWREIDEIIKILTTLYNKDKFYNSNLVDVLQHYSLIEELKKVNLN